MKAVHLLSGYTIVEMGVEHLNEVEAIERSSYSNPWPREPFLHEMEDNAFSHPKVAVTTDDARTVAGYCISWLVFKKLQIQNVALHPRHRRRGLGRYLIRRALADGTFGGVVTAELEVRGSNIVAQRLYQILGFRSVGERENHYSRPREDAVLLQKKLR